MRRVLQAEEAHTAMLALSGADQVVGAGREFYDTIELSDETISGLLVDLTDDDVTLNVDPGETNRPVSTLWADVLSVKVEGHS